MFSCESDGYEAVVFGAFDGVTSWTNNAYINLGPVHQEVVGAHEERHLRLQKGTPWGALLMLLSLAGAEERLMPLVEGCRRTHEAYATYLSTAHVADALATLEGNPLYIDYWRDAAALAAVFAPDEPVTAILEYLFHLVMSPAALADVTLDGDDATLLAHTPDVRLTTLTELLRSDPALVASIATTVTASDNVATAQDTLARTLTAQGLPTLSTDDQLAHATRLMNEFNASSRFYHVSVADRSRATSLSDQLDHQQHEILAVRRQPVPLEIGPPPTGEGAPHPLTGFVMDDERLGPHVWGVVLSSAVLQRQFILAEPLEGIRYWGLLAIDRRPEAPFARLWPLPDTPATATEKFASAGIETVLMTTMSTLTDSYARTPFAPRTPVFVLVDVPHLPFLRGLEAEVQPTRWVHAHSMGDLVLHLVILSLDGPDPLHFVLVRSAHTVRATTEWLRRNSKSFRHDPTLGSEIDSHLNALAQHLAGTFWAFDTTRAIQRPRTSPPRAS